MKTIWKSNINFYLLLIWKNEWVNFQKENYIFFSTIQIQSKNRYEKVCTLTFKLKMQRLLTSHSFLLFTPTPSFLYIIYCTIPLKSFQFFLFFYLSRRRRLVLAKRRHHLKKMDNPTAIVPYHDPFDDDSSLVQISLFDDENPIIDCPWDNEPFSLFHENPPILISDIGVSNTDPILLQCSNYLVGNSTTNTEGGVPGSNYCSTSHNCQILREITHSDGQSVLSL